MKQDRGALDGLRVVEFGGHVAASYCTKLLADLGATVTKIESRQGDPTRRCGPHGPGQPDPVGGGLFHYLNANKQSIVADLTEDPVATTAMDLIAAADAVVENFRPGVMESFGLGPERLLGVNPGLVMVRISNFGQDGPWRDRLASGLTLQAEVGLALRLGEPNGRPLHILGRLPELIGGTFAAGAALGGVASAARTGMGTVVDVSLFETVLYSLSPSDVVREVLLEQGISLPDRQQANPGFVNCLDGIVCVSTLTGQHWQDLCTLIGADDWAPRMYDSSTDMTARRQFLDRLEQWTSPRTITDVVDTMQTFRLAAAPVVDGRTILEQSQFIARDLFVAQPGASFVRPAAPYRLSATPVTLRTPAPKLGEHDEVPPPPRAAATEPSERDRLPLAGVRVIDMTSFLSGGHLSEYLAAFGADVVKIESPRRPDGYRFVVTYPALGDHWWERSPLWQAQNLAKRSLVLELSSAEGRDVLERLIAQADVIAENYTPRVLEAFGFDYGRVAEINPDIVMVRMPAFGLEGPWRDHVGFAYNIEQLAGMAQNGDPDGPFVQPYGIVDIVNGQHAVVATMAALRHRFSGGHGQLVEVAQVETVACLTAADTIQYQLTGSCRPRTGNREPGCAPQGIYPCTDGRWIAITVTTDEEWRALCKEMDNPEWSDEGIYATGPGRWEQHDVLDERLAEWTGPRAAAELAERLQAAGVPAAVLATLKEIPENPQLQARRYHHRLPHAYVGSQRYPRPPVIFSFGDLVSGPAPIFGQHNEAVLHQVGLDDSAIAELERQGVIATELIE
jgi:crotonobetainyl-CoA:carnitine CoA-transferase CaiB-like acyl-CoA transferase